jgi:antitoxin component of MazEF toxin-antitoxin module
LIRKVAGKDIKRRREVVRELNANSGKSVELVLERDGKLVTMIVEIK